MIGTVTWFNLDKKFGFVQIKGREVSALLHVSVLKEAGYVSVPAGTTLDVDLEKSDGRPRVAKVLRIDTGTALPGEADPVLRKKRSDLAL